MQAPCIEVSQLAPSTSFYAAILQPLGLRYLSSESATSGPGVATFGSTHGPVLHLRHVPKPAVLRLSSIRFSAPSLTAIQTFCRRGIDANPTSTLINEGFINNGITLDLDGNRVQAVCNELAHGSDVITGQFTLTLSPQQTRHVCRVLDWNTLTPVDGDRNGKDMLKNSSLPENLDSTPMKAEDNPPSGGGISAVLGALMGVAVGAAAGAAITYNAMSAKTPDTTPTETNRRQESLHGNVQMRNTSVQSTGLVDRDQQRSIPSKSHRIKFEEDRMPASRKCSTQPAASNQERRVIRSLDKDIESANRGQRENQLVRVPRGADIPRERSISNIPASHPASASARSASSTRRLALPAPPSASSGTRTVRKEDRVSDKEHETFVSACSRISSSSITLDQTKGTNDLTRSSPKTAAGSAMSERDRSKTSTNKGETHRKRNNDTSSSSKHSSKSELRSKEEPAIGSPCSAQPTELCQRTSKNAPLGLSRSGTSEFFDTRSQVSARQPSLPSTRTDNGSREDKRSHVSARDVPLPSSRVGTSEFFDTVSHVSARKSASHINRKDISSPEDSRSRVSARNIPLPASTLGCASKVTDSKSHVSARDIPLPASSVGIDYRDGPRSHISARNIPLPASHVGSSRADWDDDVKSIAPSDSISCIGSR